MREAGGGGGRWRGGGDAGAVEAGADNGVEETPADRWRGGAAAGAFAEPGGPGGDPCGRVGAVRQPCATSWRCRASSRIAAGRWCSTAPVVRGAVTKDGHRDRDGRGVALAHPGADGDQFGRPLRAADGPQDRGRAAVHGREDVVGEGLVLCRQRAGGVRAADLSDAQLRRRRGCTSRSILAGARGWGRMRNGCRRERSRRSTMRSIRRALSTSIARCGATGRGSRMGRCRRTIRACGRRSWAGPAVGRFPDRGARSAWRSGAGEPDRDREPGADLVAGDRRKSGRNGGV